jgi:hypothetical protein
MHFLIFLNIFDKIDTRSSVLWLFGVTHSGNVGRGQSGILPAKDISTLKTARKCGKNYQIRNEW